MVLDSLEMCNVKNSMTIPCRFFALQKAPLELKVISMSPLLYLAASKLIIQSGNSSTPVFFLLSIFGALSLLPNIVRRVSYEKYLEWRDAILTVQWVLFQCSVYFAFLFEKREENQMNEASASGGFSLGRCVYQIILFVCVLSNNTTSLSDIVFTFVWAVLKTYAANCRRLNPAVVVFVVFVRKGGLEQASSQVSLILGSFYCSVFHIFLFSQLPPPSCALGCNSLLFRGGLKKASCFVSLPSVTLLVFLCFFFVYVFLFSLFLHTATAFLCFRV